LSLAARVYNYSLASTISPIHVRFYGQLYCTSTNSSEASCKGGSTACKTTGLCGDSFQIGADQVIAGIAGFKANAAEPNWATATADFAPANFPAIKGGNAYMVFRVAVWMQDANGELVDEMPGHGLTALPASNLTQISQVKFEPYSNNIGMYGVHQQFYICPASGCVPQKGGLSAEPVGSIKIVAVSVESSPQLERRSKLSATLQATGDRRQRRSCQYCLL
jgi:hypothetical protein